jgi:hypothetical protein
MILGFVKNEEGSSLTREALLQYFGRDSMQKAYPPKHVMEVIDRLGEAEVLQVDDQVVQMKADFQKARAELLTILEQSVTLGAMPEFVDDIKFVLKYPHVINAAKTLVTQAKLQV